MNITIEMPAQEIDAIKKATQLEDDAKAVTHAAREFMRLLALRELKSASGKVDYDPNWQELEQREQREWPTKG